MITSAQSGNDYQFFSNGIYMGGAFYIKTERKYKHTDFEINKIEYFDNIDEIKTYIIESL